LAIASIAASHPARTRRAPGTGAAVTARPPLLAGIVRNVRGRAMKAWFVPPLVVPAALLLLIAAYAIFRAL
jgi:hypothetical protein